MPHGKPTTPTIILVANHGFSARALLRTDILSSLVEAGVRVVALVPNPDEAYLKEELSAAGVTLAPLHVAASFPRSRSERWLANLRRHCVGGGHRSPALLGTYQNFITTAREHHSVLASGFRVIENFLWRSRVLRRAVLRAEMRLAARDDHADTFERYRPDLVVTSCPGFWHENAAVLREAKRRGVKTATVILGWDNPTTKGYRGAAPDHAIAWSDRMAEQLVRHQDLKRRQVSVGGVPQFDRYFRRDSLWSNEELYRQLRLDPRRKLVVYAASYPRLYSHNFEVAEYLAGAMHDNRLQDAQLVVRLHPLMFRNSKGGFDSDVITSFYDLVERHEHVHLDVPDVQSQRMRFDLSEDDNVRMSSLMTHADALVCVFSTTTLEAFLAETPVVFIGKTAHLTSPEDAAPERDIVDNRPWEQFLHLSELVESGTVPISRSAGELVSHVRAALDHPERGGALRARFALEECGPTDGYAGVRIAKQLLALIDAQPSLAATPSCAIDMNCQSPLAEANLHADRE